MAYILKFLSYVVDSLLLCGILMVFFGIPALSATLLSLLSVWIYEELYEYVEFKRYGDLM